MLEPGEIDATVVVCESSDGTSSLVETNQIPAGSDACPTGGVRIDIGLDDGAGGGDAHNGRLEPGEVDDTSYVCAGATGGSCGCGTTAPSSYSGLGLLLLCGLWLGRRKPRAS